MQAETQHALDAIKSAIELLRTHIDVDAAKARLTALEAEIGKAEFFNRIAQFNCLVVGPVELEACF